MIVIVHQAIGMAEPPITINNMGEQGQKLRPIAVLHHDVLPGIAPTGDMIDGTGEFKTKRTRHGARDYPSQCVIARPDPVSSGTAARDLGVLCKFA